MTKEPRLVTNRLNKGFTGSILMITGIFYHLCKSQNTKLVEYLAKCFDMYRT